MAVTLNTLAYNQDAFVTPNKVQYTGPGNTFQDKDLLTLGRVAPKPTADFEGMARTSVKRVKTITLADGSRKDAIIEVIASFPVGTANATIDAMRDDVGDFLISADAGTLMKNHDITY